MSQLNEKTTCIFYKSLFEAAERFYEKDPATALEIYHSYFRYAFCETEGIETDNEIAELLVKQNVESFNAADNRYAAAVRNGDKGKEYGILGKEYGILGGRPRKGESREEYWERKRRECETPQKTPLTIATAITTSSTTSKTTTTTDSEAKTYSLEENEISFKEEIVSFLNTHSDYDYILLTCNKDRFFSKYRESVIELEKVIENKTGDSVSTQVILGNIYACAQEIGIL